MNEHRFAAALLFAFVSAACGDGERVDEVTSSAAGSTSSHAAGTGGGAATGSASTMGTGGTGGAATGGGGSGAATAASIVDCDGETVAATISMVVPQYDPDAAAVAVEGVIKFANDDIVPLTSTSGTVRGAVPTPDGNWDTGDIVPGDSACIRFNVAGSYSFYCSVHPASMQGIVIVQ
jgi:plastocyanin